MTDGREGWRWVQEMRCDDQQVMQRQWPGEQQAMEAGSDSERMTMGVAKGSCPEPLLGL